MNVIVSNAQDLLDEIARRAQAGEHLVLTSNGEKVAEIKPDADLRDGKKSILGAFKGQIWMADDFDELGPEWDEYIK